jgi:hypothetical protein
MKIKYIFVGAVVLLLAFAIVSCSPTPAPTQAPATEKVCPSPEPCPECPACPSPEPPPTPVVQEVPFQDLWANSPHNKADAEAFNHWNEEDPAEVPTSCATCHTSAGYQEYVATGKIEKAIPAPAGTIQCVTCHNEAAASLTSVKFPQTYVPEGATEPVNVVISGLGPEARCMVCHQGRASKSSVDNQVAKFGENVDPDAVPAPIKDAQGNDVKLGFINIHYFPAGATLYGTEAKGGYEYDGKSYDYKFRHVEGIDTCIGCHDQHSLEVRVEKCAECHEGVTSVDDLKNVRMQGSLADYNGNGNVEEGIAAELAGMQDILYKGIQEYAKTVAGTGIVYDPATYPYFLADADGNGEADKNDQGAAVGYSSWTPRLLKAAYNYHMSVKDPGDFAHNAKYMIELLYDSTEDLNAKLGTIDMTAMHREDPGHFAGSTEPFRHWDEEGEVSASCAKCHSATGLPQFIKYGTNIGNPISNGFMCSTCHDSANWPNRYTVAEVTFPSGAKVTFGGKDADGNPVADDSNLCLMCHQGRSSTVTVNNAMKGKDPETVDPKISFSNIHYFAAGATLFGTEVKGAYEFDGKTYVGFNAKHPLNKCKDCHEVHALEVKVEACTACHSSASDPKDPATYRMDPTDWNGNGDTKEGVKAEIATFGERLYTALQAYAKAKGTPIVYDVSSNPYFFVDMNEDGKADVDEKGAKIRYNAWTPTLMEAAYNYQYWQKDPGAFTHNPKYVMQFLYDSIVAVGGDVAGLTRPEVPAP